MLSARLARSLARREVHYGWVVVAVTFMTMLATAAAMGMPGLLLVALKREFGWSESAVSGALALRLIMFGLMGPFAASLIQRHGVRATTGCALLAIVGGLAISMNATELWQLWIGWGVLVGLGTGATAVVLGAAVANRWFVARRGLVLGLLTASAATGQLLFLPLAAWLEDYAGWRWALVPAILACVVAGVLTLLIGVDDPARLGLVPFGEVPRHGFQIWTPRAATPGPKARGDGAIGLAFQALVAASGSRVFWMLFLTFFVCGLSTTGLVQVHLIPLCMDHGIGPIEAAGFLAVIGGFDFIGTIASGWLSDRFDNHWLLAWYYGSRAVALLLLPLTGFSALGLGVFAVFYGLDWIATVPPTVNIASAAFGRERAPLVFGWIFTAHQLGAATAAFGGGLSRELLGGYEPVIMAAAAGCLIAATATIGLRVRAPMVLAEAARA